MAQNTFFIELLFFFTILHFLYLELIIRVYNTIQY